MKQEKQTNMTTKKEDRIRIITPEFRVSFPSLFTARKVNQNDPNEKAKFSIQMLFCVKETEKTKAAGMKVVDLNAPAPGSKVSMRQAVMDLFAKNLGANWQEELKKRKGDGSPLYRSPFRDGNAPEKRDVEGYGEGIVFVTASSQYKPGVIDGQKVEIINPQDIQGGFFARAEIHPYWYNTKGNQGVTFGLDNVQLIRPGQPFSGRSKAEDVFDALPTPEGAPVGAAAGAAGASTAADPLMG